MFGFLFADDTQKMEWVNYDENDVPKYELPEALKMENGDAVGTPEKWTDERRGELYELFAQQMFGKLPPVLQEAGNYPDFVTYELMEEDTEALGGKAIRRQVAIYFCPPETEKRIEVLPEAEASGVKKCNDSAKYEAVNKEKAGEEGLLDDDPRPAQMPDAATAPVRDRVEMTFSENAGFSAKAYQVAVLLIYIPKNAEGAVPVFLSPNFQGNHTVCDDSAIFLSGDFLDENGKPIQDESRLPHERRRGSDASRWPLEKILDAGFALATVFYQDLVPDKNDGLRAGLPKVYGKDFSDKGSWAAISAWAWGLSRAMDYLETDEKFDSRKVALMGHSRLGKTALWAGAGDPRFAVIISNNSGCGGAAISRREFGERVERINRVFPHWFCENFHGYGDCVNDLPFDQHELIALIAPRPVYVASAQEDLWADPYGEFLSAFHAVPVYKLLGTDAFGDVTDGTKLPPLNVSVGGTIGYHIRAGAHDVTDFDWDQYIGFVKKHFRMEGEQVK